jgi:hypothetical protein
VPASALVVLVGLALVPPRGASPADSRGIAGDPKDRLDWPGSPTDRWLEAEEIRAALHGATESFFACFREHVRGTEAPGDVSVSFMVPRDGRPAQVQVQADRAPESLRPCVAGVVSGLALPAHDGDPVEAAYPLVLRVDREGARVLPYPVVFIRRPPPRLPLLALPGDLPGPGLSELEAAMKAPPAPSPPAPTTAP